MNKKIIIAITINIVLLYNGIPQYFNRGMRFLSSDLSRNLKCTI